MCSHFIPAAHGCGRVFIGTSGWNYAHWKGVFYPKELKPSKWLEFLAQHFDTVEINNSFYRLPSQAIFQSWQEQVPQNFTFAVKASRFLTHIKRLKDPDDPLNLFFSRAKLLKGQLGPVLFQLPPQFKVNLERLENFLKALRRSPAHKHIRCVIEVREATWLSASVFELLAQHRVALCFADWRDLHVTTPLTTDFVYVRRHYGPAAGNYGKRDLDRDAEQIAKWRRNGADVYVYFNNDMNGHAIRNAHYLQKRIAP